MIQASVDTMRGMAVGYGYNISPKKVKPQCNIALAFVAKMAKEIELIN